MTRTLEEDIRLLELKIDELIVEAKKYSISDLVGNKLRISTVCNVIQRRSDILSINTSTLFLLAKKVDTLSDKTESYFLTIHYFIEQFIEKHIDVVNVTSLVNIGLAKKSLDKMFDIKIQNPFRLNTMIRYAKIVAEKKESWGDLEDV
ncbi:hypothetical protein [Mammaliicoccus sp. E-M21]|uniref:hypothetical protein n=1 Tax=Mammaliicoccus sp. E-M21 TaxID=2898681 RepID=UPI001EFAF8DA|nr:hypothetical protein [Mammaliicoccus sp. E-M21]